MSDTNYPGIDYGMGRTNISAEGIHYGVIPIHQLSEWVWDNFEPDYGDPTCGHCGNDLVEFDEEKHGEYPEIQGCADYACEHCEIVVDSSDAYGDEPICHVLDDGEYKATVDSYNDVFLVASPYYTHAQYCSPCAPGAGHLSNPCESGPRTYCFGHDWFSGGVAPYPVYRVSDGTLVQPEEK